MWKKRVRSRINPLRKLLRYCHMRRRGNNLNVLALRHHVMRAQTQSPETSREFYNDQWMRSFYRLNNFFREWFLMYTRKRIVFFFLWEKKKKKRGGKICDDDDDDDDVFKRRSCYFIREVTFVCCLAKHVHYKLKCQLCCLPASTEARGH